MLDNFIPELIRKQRPYYLPQGNPIKGINDQYWLVFQHRDADNPLHNVIKFLGMGNQNATHKLLRIDPKTAKVFEYIPLKEGDLPSVTLLRTCELSILEKFLHQERVTTEPALLAGSFLEIPGRQRRFSLPPDLDKYRQFFTNILQRTKIYRRSTAYFDSGVLKLYQEPLAAIVETEGQIRLLMDWQGFTKLTDIAELDKLYNPSDRYQFIQRTLEEFLQGLAEGDFTETEILAELVRLGFLQIRLIKMDSGKALYHKKTGIFTDQLDHHIQHEGSDNFTRAAHSRNAESMTFLYSWKEFLLTHYEFNLKSTGQTDRLNLDDDERETWDEEYEEEEEAQEEQPQKRQKLRRSIDSYTTALENQPDRARHIYNKMLADCDNDLQQIQEIQTLLQAEFVIDHKKEQVRQKVRELVKLGQKVLLISTFSDTVIDYYLYMAQDQAIASQGIGMLTGSPKLYSHPI